MRRHRDTAGKIWLVFFSKHTGKPTLDDIAAVEEALCFGWIDSNIKRIDEERYMRKFTPRKPGSRWSDLNKRRAEKLMNQGRMTDDGREKTAGNTEMADKGVHRPARTGEKPGLK